MSKKICFVGHRDEWIGLAVKNKVFNIIEELIKRGFNYFYDGNYGGFDAVCLDCLKDLKKKYPHIKIVRVLAQYSKEKSDIPQFVDESVCLELENVYYKQRITKRNEWIVDNSDIVVCCVINTFNSGAYKTKRYAEKQHKKIIDVMTS